MALAVYKGGPAYMEIDTFFGNDDSIVCDFTTDITGYTFTISLYGPSNALLFTNNGVVSGSSPTWHVTYAISSAQNQTIPDGSTYVMSWAAAGLKRAWCSGPFVVARP